MSVRIGVSPLSWTNDDMPELGGETPVATCLSEARQIGYQGIELGNKFPRQPDALKALLGRHDIGLVSGWYGTRLLERSVAAEIREMESHRALLAALGCEIMVVAEVSGRVYGDRKAPLCARPTLNASDFERLGASLTEVARHLDDHGLRLAYHHHMGTVVETFGEIEQLLDCAGEQARLLLDTGHLYFAGADPAEAARRWAGRIAHVHLKDVRRQVLEDVRARDASFLDAVLAGVFTVPGDGAVDFPPVLEALAGAGYEGWLVVEAEQDPGKADPVLVATLGFETVQTLARDAGLA